MSGTSFKDLAIWNKSKELAIKIYKVTNIGEFTKDYSLRDQIRKSAVSIPSNIAEGNGRESDKDYLRFLYIGKGSLCELRTQLEIAYEIGYINQEAFSQLEDGCEEIAKMLTGLIKAINNKAQLKGNG